MLTHTVLSGAVKFVLSINLECSSERLCVLQEERISTTLVGMATRDMVRKNIASVSKALSKPLDKKQLAALDDIERVFADVRDLSWESGKPENN